jgi:integrative and conjugative element protein (TIGR02256 family)
LLKIVRVHRKPFDAYPLAVEISLSTKHLRYDEAGVRLRDRERLLLLVPDDFPFQLPAVGVPHVRFAGLPHVQWGSHICLYLSPSTEWNPADGLFGFLERIEDWLSGAASGTLVDVVGPIHPPVAYTSPRLGARAVVICSNTPDPGSNAWFGIARLKERHDQRVDVCGFMPTSNISLADDEIAGAAILLSAALPFEYPSTFQDLVVCLKPGGVTTKDLLKVLAHAAKLNNPIYPLYVLIGAPMRRMPGSDRKYQHLAVWYLNQGTVSAIRRISELLDAGEERNVDDYIRTLEAAPKAPIEWCKMMEARPEVTIRRDDQTPMNWFKDKCVAVLGAGALGATVCEFLVRAGVKKLSIYDRGIISPGILVRQPFTNGDIGKLKVEALKTRLKQIRRDLEIDVYDADVLKRPLGLDDWTEGADVLIDATANTSVLAKLESVRQQHQTRRIPTVSMVVGPKAERGVVLLSGHEYSGGLLDVSRKAKLAACSTNGMSEYLTNFWSGNNPAQPFQPEPGCSESTFVGSAADVVTLAGMMINCAARDLASIAPSQASAFFVTQPWLGTAANSAAHLTWERDVVLSADASGYEIRMEHSAAEDLHKWIDQGGRTASSTDETGGVLFGEINDACQIAWITEVTGPPPDSSASPVEFTCGTVGVQESNEMKRAQSKNSVHFLGLWHTHPDSVALPSTIDLNSALELLYEKNSGLSKVLMLISAGKNGKGQLGCGVFRRNIGTTQWLMQN